MLLRFSVDSVPVLRHVALVTTALVTTTLGATVLGAIAAPATALTLTLLGSHSTGVYDEGGAEIATYDPDTQRLFVVNGSNGNIDVLDISDPSAIISIRSIELDAFGKAANSVAFRDGVLAAAVENDDKQAPGRVVFFDADGNVLNSVPVGALPDMVTFSPDGNTVLVANEGEPNDDYSVDPEGSVSLIDLSNGVPRATVRTATFTAFNAQVDALRAGGIRVYGPNATLAQDFEPEYIAVSSDSSRAWVTLQENNALGILNVLTGEFEDIVPLGFKPHGEAGNGLDASDKDDAINIATYANLFGMYQPDAIASYSVDGRTYLVTANEGDSRDYDGFSEEARVADLTLDPAAFPDAATLQASSALGRLTVTQTLGDANGDGLYEQLYVLGGRSFSIWDESGNLVFDSGDAFEQILAQEMPNAFNANNTENGTDNRSDNKGPEPEGLTLAQLGDRTYAFIGLERIGGVMVYDITDPTAPSFIRYANRRDFALPFDEDTFSATNEDGDPAPAAEQLLGVGDLGPEGLLYISAADSPIDSALLVVANEVSGTTTLYAITP